MSMHIEIDGAPVSLFRCARMQAHGGEGYVALVQCTDEITGEVRIPDFALADDAGADHITKIMTKHVVWAMRVEGGSVRDLAPDSLEKLAAKFGFIV